jgi:hypothetical protein
MADTKITGLTALTGANSAPDDLLTLVDVSDTTMDAAGTNKSITRQELQTYNAGTLTTDVKVLDLSATWNAGAVTFTGLKFNVTNTASAAASLLLDLQVDGATVTKVNRTGTVLAAPGSKTDTSFATRQANTGVFSRAAGFFNVSAAGVTRIDLSNADLFIGGYVGITGTADAEAGPSGRLYCDANHNISVRTTTNAQSFRVYNTFTDASNYERLGITWGSNIVTIKPEAAGTGTVRVLHISGLPTSNPGPGILWNNAGTPAIGT